MLPHTKSNKQFQMQYSMIYSDGDIFKSNSDMGLPQISYDLFENQFLSYIHDNNLNIIQGTYFPGFISCCMVDNNSPFFILSLWG